ncbi:MAG: hypothetical protein V4736_13795 [Bdellovibrionota bacterium]
MVKKDLLKIIGLFSFVLVLGCSTHTPTAQSSSEQWRMPAQSQTQFATDKLKFPTIYNVADFKGITFFTFMKETVKPSLDKYATEGFKVADSAQVIGVLKNVGQKVNKHAMADSGGQSKLAKLADTLNKKGETVTLYNLPDKIAETRIGKDRYGLSTFLALASGGGVAIRLDDKNYYYNVNYGTGKTDKDEMTGRSFGAGPIRDADDVSDKTYLGDLQEYVTTPNQDLTAFYKNLFQILLNCDPSLYSTISPLGQNVTTDFLAVYTAESDRHLMSNLRSHPWDEALLEVTLLSAFHAGQSKIMVMFDGKLRDTVPKQAPGGEPRTKMQQASMIDYWQFSSNPSPESKNRSGINVTRKEFRALEIAISKFERKNHPELVEKVEKHFAGVRTGGNVFAELSEYLINFKTPRQLGPSDLELANDMTEFLMQVKKDANEITQFAMTSQ